MNHKFLYSLRYAVEPGFHTEEKLDALVHFCIEAGIGDVMLFINCEELNRGHLTTEETIPWLDVIRRAQEKLRPAGITTSINPWITLLHCDRGRVLKEGQKFNRMVDPYGRSATAVACPLCPQWRSYITDMYALYAALNPYILWVEDDFRLHNHAPLEWGGCFCDEHIKEYSRRAGENLTREEFVKGILKTGEPHAYRNIWLDTSRDTMVELARLIGDAVHRVSPDTQIGLMSSGPAVHCSEGRDWEGIFQGFSGNRPGINRIHLPCYVEMSPQQYLIGFNNISRLSCAMTPDQTVILPELENFPHTRFSKSITFSRFQIETSLLIGSAGITLNIFDMMGNGVLLGEEQQKMLKEDAYFLTSVKSIGLKVEKQSGIKVMTNQNSSFTLHTANGKRMDELYPKEYFWAGLLSAYGISNTYSTVTAHENEILAVSGQYFRNLDIKEIQELFENNFILMDGEAAYVLFEMGVGHLAGIKNAVWHQLDSGFQSYEQVCDGSVYCGLHDARISSQGYAGDFLEVGYEGNIQMKTEVKNYTGQTVAPGVALYNEKVLILPYGRFNSDFSSNLHPVKQEIIQKALTDYTGPRCPVFVKREPYVAAYEYILGHKKALVLCNASGDNVSEVIIHAPEWKLKQILEINRKAGGPVNADIVWENECMILKSGLENMELKVLVIENI